MSSSPRKYFLLGFLTITFLLFELWIGGVWGFFSMILTLVAFSALIVGGLFLLFVLLGRQVFFSRLITDIILYAGAINALLYMIVFAIAYYANSISPAYLGRVTLTNGEKTLIFQQMSHIATPRFYQEVSRDISQKTASGFVIFYEGVGTGSVESANMLNNALGIQFDHDTYAELAGMIGMVEQDYDELFAGSSGSSDQRRNVDMDLDSLMQKYAEINTQTGVVASGSIMSDQEVIDIGAAFSGVTMNPREEIVVRYIVSGFLNLMIGSQDQMMDQLGDEQTRRLFSVLLDERNLHIAKSINSAKETRLYALYGALHFDGVYRELQRLDPRWKIVSSEPIRPY